ncbi:MAG: hypothetical protein ABIF80_04055 [Patescibacteria group bacterium]
MAVVLVDLASGFQQERMIQAEELDLVRDVRVAGLTPGISKK